MEGTRGSLAGLLVPVSDPESTDRAFFVRWAGMASGEVVCVVGAGEAIQGSSFLGLIGWEALDQSSVSGNSVELRD